MSLAVPNNNDDDDEEPDEAAEANSEEPDNSADLAGDEESDHPSPDEIGDAEEIYLEWADEYGIHENGTLPLREAVEENGRVFADAAMEWDLEDVEDTIEDLQDEVETLQEENQELRERIDSLQGWKGSVVERMNETSENVRLLLTASDLDVNGACPECSGGSLEAVTGFGQTNRVECANEDCGHVAAELE